jgi:hypothetical protein
MLSPSADYFNPQQIKRWFAYQHMKDHDLDPTETGAHNPYRPLLFKLTGKGGNPPHSKPPVHLWRRTHKEVIEATLKTRAIALGTKRGDLAKLREQIARELFSKLDPNDQRSWKGRAMTEHHDATAAWKKEMESQASTAPLDRQRFVLSLYLADPRHILTLQNVQVYYGLGTLCAANPRSHF